MASQQAHADLLQENQHPQGVVVFGIFVVGAIFGCLGISILFFNLGFTWGKQIELQTWLSTLVSVFLGVGASWLVALEFARRGGHELQLVAQQLQDAGFAPEALQTLKKQQHGSGFVSGMMIALALSSVLHGSADIFGKSAVDKDNEKP